MKYNINFQQHGEIQDLAKDNSKVILDALVLYEGEFEDAHGQKVCINKELMYSLADNYKNHLKTYDSDHGPVGAIKKIFGKKARVPYKNVILDHKKGAVRDIVGKVQDLHIREIDGKAFLFAKLMILKQENVENVIGDPPLWTDMSISFEYEDVNNNAELNEISYVYEPALQHAMSFSSSSNTHLQNTKNSVELQESREELSKLSSEKKRIEAEIKAVKTQQSTVHQFNKMVKDGLISRSDFKKIMIDMQGNNDSPHESLVRVVSTVAKSKKAARGRINSNFSAQVFENFVDNLQTPTRNSGEKQMTTEVNPEKVADAIIHSINGGKKAADFAAVPHNSKMDHDIHKEEKHEEAEHMIHFKKDDMHRLHHMLKSGMSHAEIMDYMHKEMGYAPHHEEHHEHHEHHEGHHKHHGEHHEHSATGANNEPVATGMEYAKNLDKKVTDLQANLDKVNTTIEALMNKFVEMSKTAGGDK